MLSWWYAILIFPTFRKGRGDPVRRTDEGSFGVKIISTLLLTDGEDRLIQGGGATVASCGKEGAWGGGGNRVCMADAFKSMIGHQRKEGFRIFSESGGCVDILRSEARCFIGIALEIC